MAQVVTWYLVTAEAQIQFQASLCGIYGRWSGTERGFFLQALQSFLSVSFSFIYRQCL